MLVYKQIIRQLLRNRIFISLILLLSILTSFSFFFVRFTIDGNQDRIAEIATLGGDIERYKTALRSNTTLAFTFFTAMLLLDAFVLLIFYYRFFRAERKQFGCLKAFGFKDANLQRHIVLFTAILALISCVMGLVLAYPLSSILLQANVDAYGVSGLMRTLNISTILFCFIVSILIFSLVSFLSYAFIKGKEPGGLLAGLQAKNDMGLAIKFADKIADILPMKNKYSVRIMLRKPLIVLLVLIAVSCCSVFMILAYSLNISSKKVLQSQTVGHNYEYTTEYTE